MGNIKITLTLLTIFLFSFVSCGDSASVKLGKELKSSYTYDGQEVELEGTLYPSMLTFTNGEIMNVGLTEKAGRGSIHLANVRLRMGTEPNCIDLPKNFTPEDVFLYDNNGEKIKAHDTKVKVKGTVVYSSKGPKKESSAAIKVPVPGKEDKEDDGNDYTFHLKDVTITKL